jgi:hypothetical protein
MAHKTPLAVVKEKFGDKTKLVAALEKLTGDLWVSRTNASKGLAHVSNAKLLRLHATFTEVKAKFGSRDKLVEAVLAFDNRAKDAGLREKLSSWPVPRLYDAYRSAAKRAGAATSGEEASKAAVKAEAKKAPSKAAAKASAKGAKAPRAAK